MFVAVMGAILMIAGIAMVVRKTAETWLQRRAGTSERGKSTIPFPAMALIGLGALLVTIATSGWL